MIERRSQIPFTFSEPVLALGGEQKSRFCLARGDRVLISPDFGDLRYAGNLTAYRAGLAKACREEKFTPRILTHDLHPEYATTLLAPDLAASFSPRPDLRPVQHHHAHLAAVLAERGNAGPVIGIIWDGTGYGEDGAIWGGEFLVGGIDTCRRAAHLEYIPLPGGEKAIAEPWRMAVAALHQFREEDLSRREMPFTKKLNRKKLPLLLSMIERGINSPPTSSMGRLFDAVSALIGTGWTNHYPAEAAIALEEAATDRTGKPYPFRLRRRKKPYSIQLKPLFFALLADIKEGRGREVIAARFHATVIAIGSRVAGELARETGLTDIVLSGGVFLNRIVREGLAGALEAGGLKPILPKIFSVDDGSIAFGQAVAAGEAENDKRITKSE